jgi:outer membrane protein TolC
MKLRKTLLVSLALGLSLKAAPPASGAPVDAAPTNSLKLEWVIGAVLSNNPALKAARARWEAMRERIPQARAWADPRAGVDAERSDSLRFAGFTDLEWMVSQELPLTGKNRLRSKAATFEAEATLAELRRRELDLAARARAAYHRYANGQVQLEINRRNEEVLRQLTELSRQKYELGRRTQADVFVAETELAKNAELRSDLERGLSDEQSQLNTLMNLPPQNPLPAPEPIAFVEAKLDLLKMQAAALEHRPDLLGVRRRIDAAQANVTLARRAWVPDPELRIEARQFEQGGLLEYDTGLFVSLPWFNRGKYQGAIREARKNQESAEQELAALQSETLGMVRDQLRKIETFRHHYAIFRDRVFPLARQAVEASRIAYTAEQAGIFELLGAQRSAYETESRMQQHLTDYLTALAELEPMVGTMTHGRQP